MLNSRPGGKLGGIANALDYYCRKQHRRVRSTFTAELYNMIDITNLALVIASLLTEVTFGAMSAERLCDAADAGRFAFPVEPVVDARSVFDALASSPVKPPEEKSMLLRLLKFREWLDLGVVRALWWCDTDDMVADAMTKGSVDREAVLKLCNDGAWIVSKAPARFSAVEKIAQSRE